MSKPAVFIDRDGVINQDYGYVGNQDDFEYIEGVFDACRTFRELGYLLVLVTNQSGIARGYFSEDDFLNLTEWMDWNFADHGIDFDGIYYCPHHPEAENEKYGQECECRKPKPGMFLSAKSFLNIDMVNSVMIGDKPDDMKAAKAAGVGMCVLVETGKGVTEEGKELANMVLPSVVEVAQYLKNNAPNFI